MKTLWNMVSFLAVVNLIALAIFVGWLWRSDRLDVQRVRTLREVFAPTIAEAGLAADEAASEEAGRQTRAATAARAADPPLPSGVQVRRAAMTREVDRQAERQLLAMTDQQRSEFENRTARLDDREAALAEQRREWAAQIAAAAGERADEQFAKTVRLYEALSGKPAKRLLLELVDRGEIDQAVAYLDAMNSRAAAKTLRELKSDEESKLAAELLERLRTYRQVAEDTETLGYVEPAAADSRTR